MNSIFNRKTLVIAVALLSLGAVITVANASHSWGGYHWGRTSNPFTLKLGNNTSGTWKNLLGTVSADWSKSTALDTSIVAGGTTARRCRPTLGRDEVCNYNYGNTGWLGVAQIWVYGDGHIAQGTVRNNDYYFGSSTYKYNNEAEKLHVICQEIGHTLGLDHQSTDGSSLNTCMDYYYNTSGADTLSTKPNAHDYDELDNFIYAHLDSTNTVFATAFPKGNNVGNNVDVGTDDRSGWGKEIRKNSRGHNSLFERDFGGGNKVFTFVIWTQE